MAEVTEGTGPGSPSEDTIAVEYCSPYIGMKSHQILRQTHNIYDHDEICLASFTSAAQKHVGNLLLEAWSTEGAGAGEGEISRYYCTSIGVPFMWGVISIYSP